MKRLLVLLAAGLFLAAPAKAQTIDYLSGLGAGTTVATTDTFALCQTAAGCGSAQTLVRETIAQLDTHIASLNAAVANAATARTNLGLVIGANVEAWSANLDTFAGVAPGTGVATALGNALNTSTGLIGDLAPTNNNCVVGNGSAWTSAACPGGGSVSVTAATPNVVITPSPGTGTFTVGSTNSLENPTDSGTHTYAIQSTDGAQSVNLASTFTAATLPASSTTGFGSGFALTLLPEAAITLTATTSTINGIAGATGIKIGAYQPAYIQGDGTNYQVNLGIPQCSTQTGSTFIRDDGTCAAPAGAGTVTQNGNLTTHAPVIGGTNGTSDVKTVAAMTDGQIVIGATGADPVPHAMSQDCTMTTGGVVTCLKTNNTSFTSAATTAIGTSGATIPLLNGNNTESGNNVHTGSESFAQVNGSSRVVTAGSTDTLLATDCGKAVIYNNAAYTVTIPASIVPASGTTCRIDIITATANKATVTGTAVSAATLVSADSYTGTQALAGSAVSLLLTTVGASTDAFLFGHGS